MSEVHAFEEAGLGVAPFRVHDVIDAGRRVGECDYCGTGIRIHCLIADASGKLFTVGSDCVEQTGDLGLRLVIDRYRTIVRDRAHAAKKDRLRAALAHPATIAALKAVPHPMAYQAGCGQTRFEWATTILNNGGLKGVNEALGYLSTASCEATR